MQTCLPAIALTALVFSTLLLSGCGEDRTGPEAAVNPQKAEHTPSEPATYLGSSACADCHAAQSRAWRNSHHDLALQQADHISVLADFNHSSGGTTFDQRDGEFRIAPAGSTEPKQVVYTFGVEPLQQYVIPGERGALQTFPSAWDSRPAESGGGRWFDLYDSAYPPGDPMHWNGRANRWNSMCADCHSTALEKHYDPQTRSYATRFAEEDVGCEACHGPGSRHAQSPSTTPLATLASQREQINVCAQCHSRRGQIAEGFRPEASFFDHYAPRLLTADLYHVDGQINDEVYVYGSFLQSRMHRAGVTCSNCHDPHSGQLDRPANETCTLCHQGSPDYEFADLSAGNFDTPEHHFHPPGSEAAQCVSCHMPSKTYMGVDERRDHSFRIPRPDLAATLGVPDVCTGCHQDQSPEWAGRIISDRFGEKRADHFATIFAEADRGNPEADGPLSALVADDTQPIMVRASALARLGGYGRGYTLDAIRLARKDEPLLRFAAPLAASSLAPDTRWRLIGPLLDDELMAVRHQAVTALLPTLAGDAAYRQRLAPYLETWLVEQSLNLDYPETLTNIAGAQMALGRPAQAEAALTEALHQQPNWVPGIMNLSDLYRATGRDPQAGALLRQALQLAPELPEVTYGYALWLSRQGRLNEGLPYFEQAAGLAPDQLQFAYAWAIALNDSGAGERAIHVLNGLLTRWPDDPQLLLAAITMLRDQGRYRDTLPLLDRLLDQRPGDQQLLQFREAMAAAAASA